MAFVDFSHPQLYDPSNLLSSVIQARKFNDEQDQLNASKSAGDLAASGDYTGAANALYRSGQAGAAQNMINYGVNAKRRAIYQDANGDWDKTAQGLATTGDVEGAVSASKFGQAQSQQAAWKNLSSHPELFNNPEAAKDFLVQNGAGQWALDFSDKLRKESDANLEHAGNVAKALGPAILATKNEADLDRIQDMLDGQGIKFPRNLPFEQRRAFLASISGLTQNVVDETKAKKLYSATQTGPNGEEQKGWAGLTSQGNITEFKPETQNGVTINPSEPLGDDGETKLAKDAAAIKAAYDKSNAGTPMPDAVANDLARNKNLRAEVQTGADGRSHWVYVDTKAGGGPRVASELQTLQAIQKQHEDYNKEHENEIKAGTLQPLETDLGKLQRSGKGIDVRETEAQTHQQLAGIQQQRVDILSDAEKRKAAEGERNLDFKERGLNLQEQKFAEGTPFMREAMAYKKDFDATHNGATISLADSMRFMKDAKDLSPVVDPTTNQAILTQLTHSGKLSQQAEAVKSVESTYANQYPKAKPLPEAAALSAATAITSKFNAGLQVTGWNFDADGNPTTPIYSAPSGTSANLRANQWNEDAQYLRARSQKAGGLQANNDQRAAFVAGAFNHLSMAERDLQDPSVERAINVIQSDPRYQNYRGLMFPSDVETPTEYGKIRQELESAQAEIERVYLQGQGVVTDSERNALKGIIVGIKDAPNAQTALNLVKNAKELISGIVETPSLRDVQQDSTLKEARTRGLGKIDSLIKDNSGKGASQPRAEGPSPAPHQVSSVDEARALIQSGKLKAGDQFIDEHGITRTVH